MRKKEDLVRALAKRCDILIQDAEFVYDALIETLKETIIEDGECVLGGLITLQVVEYSANPMYDFKTGKMKKCPKTVRLRSQFHPSFKKLVKDSYKAKMNGEE